jgi:CRISPR-associated endonuclease/helicase Cas3
LNSQKNIQDENYILVSTQCIEAGVDADFDVGIRDIAILDSLEQVAGRVNREGTKGERCPVYIVALKRDSDVDNVEADSIYGKSNRWESFYKSDQLQNIITKRDFEKYYDLTIKTIDHKTKMPSGHEIEERERLLTIQKLELDKMRDYKLIRDNETQTFFVPVNIDKKEFSENELRLLPETIENNLVIGNKMWELYKKISEMNGSRYQKIRLAQINSMLNKFLVRRRKRRGEVFDESIVLLQDWQNSYDLVKGFKKVGESDII